MKRKTNILFIILIISTLSLVLIPNFTSGSIADIHYNFENDVLYSSKNPSFNQSSNLRNPIQYFEEYNSSYFISNDSIGLEPIGWTDTSTGGCTTEIIEIIDGHNSTVEIDDVDGGVSLLTHTFEGSGQDFGTIELWFRTDDITKSSYIKFVDGATNVFVVHIQSSLWKYNFGLNVPNVNNPINDVWFHLKIHFDGTVGGYKGLAQYDFEVIINGISSGHLNYLSNEIECTDLILTTNSVHSGYTSYFDAVGFSWLSNYTINNNYFPIRKTDKSIYQVDRHEFTLSNVNSLYLNGQDNLNTWIDIEIGGGDLVGCWGTTNPNNKIYYYIHNNDAGSERGISKNFAGLVNSNFVNITFGIEFGRLDGIQNNFWIEIDTFDSTLISYLLIESNGNLRFADNLGWHTLRNDMVINTYYEFNLCLNYELDRIFLLMYAEGIFVEYYEYNMIVLGKHGLATVELYASISDANWFDFKLDYVGIYDSGHSLASEVNVYAWTTVIFNKAWEMENHNLFTINASGSIYLGAVQGFYEIENTMRPVFATESYSNISLFMNLYDKSLGNFADAGLLLTFTGSDFLLNSLHIEGAKLTDGINEYFLEYEHSGINLNESYFWTDNDNKLQFTLITNDTNTEYIQATFDIPNIDSTDRAISFRGYRSNLAYGYFVVDYLAGISTVDIPIIEKTTRGILPANKTIDNFIILITDNDIDTILGTTIGYVSQPILLNVLGIGLPIITAGLIEMMIPLLLIIVPTLLISKGFGKEGKKLLIPLFLVFSLIATATLIIPVWIFFIIAFGNGLFLFRNKEIESDI